uniref:Uncharacterized protein n=1 Tax=Cacopsylla melanoneura TaxID=428564 RepID=A0A8D8XIX6_9HEMI
MLCLKLLSSLFLLGLAVAAPRDLNNDQAAVAADDGAAPKQHRVERNRRGLLGGDDTPEDGKLDLEHEIPLRVLEKSLELNDGEGDNEVNGTKKIDNKNIEYYHKKNKGTIKTIVEEKDQDENKLENVFYHLSYEKETPSTVEPAEDTTLPEDQTTDQTLADDDEEETVTPSDNEYINLNNADDATIPPSEEAFVPLESSDAVNQDQEQQQPQQGGRGWFNNWFNWVGQTISDDSVTESATTQPAADLPDTPHLDQAIGGGQQFTILSPFYFGSIGLKSPDCPQHRPTQISIYFFSFCV